MKDDVSLRVMSRAGKEVRLKLKEIYGSPEEAEKAIMERVGMTVTMEQWATVTQHRRQKEDRKKAQANGEMYYTTKGIELEKGEMWRLDHIPEHMRHEAKIMIAAAMLVWEHEQQIVDQLNSGWS